MGKQNEPNFCGSARCSSGRATLFLSANAQVRPSVQDTAQGQILYFLHLLDLLELQGQRPCCRNQLQISFRSVIQVRRGGWEVARHQAPAGARG
jgi:hypothetical protein